MPASALARAIPQTPGKMSFTDFAPDLDPTTPGILLECGNMAPTIKGFKSYPGLTEFSENALPSAGLGLFSGFLGSTYVIVAGVSGDLFKLDNQSWVDQGVTLTASSNRWRFDVYGTKLMATNGLDPVQQFTAPSTWAALAGSPPVSSIVQATDHSLFLITVNTNTWISSLSGTDWTPAIANSVVTGNLDSTHGNITAGHALRSGIALYKNAALHMGFFVGPPFFWDFRKISDEIGAPSQEAVANLGYYQLFPGQDDFYKFDGFTLERIPNNLKEWFFRVLDGPNKDKMAARWDIENSLVFWHFHSISASPEGPLDSWICYNLRSHKWTGDTAAEKVDLPAFRPLETGHLTYDKWTTTFPTYGGITAGTLYGDLKSRVNSISGAVRSSDQFLHLYNGASTGFVTSHDFGDRHSQYMCNRVKPWFSLFPTSGATLQPLNQQKDGTTPVGGATKNISDDGWFNIRNTALLQRYKITGLSDFEIEGIDAQMEYAGEHGSVAPQGVRRLDMSGADGFLWALEITKDGELTTTKGVAPLSPNTPTIWLQSPDLSIWDVTVGTGGTVLTTKITATATLSALQLTAPDKSVWTVAADNNGILSTTKG